MKQRKETYTGLLQQHHVYEARPYFCLFIGGVGMVNAHQDHSLTSFCSGLILIVCGFLLISWRAASRG